MSALKFEPNAPVTVALKYASGKHVTSKYFGGEQVMYSLLAGGVMYVPVIVEKQLQELNVKPGQPVEILKEQAEGQTRWTVKRIEQARKPMATAQNGQAAARIVDEAENLDGPDISTNAETRDSVETIAERNLELALRISISAAKKAEEFGQQIGKPIQFDKNDVRSMALTLVINGRGRAA